MDIAILVFHHLRDADGILEHFVALLDNWLGEGQEVFGISCHFEGSNSLPLCVQVHREKFVWSVQDAHS